MATATTATTCQMANCDNGATAKPQYDANPDRAARKVIGHVAICDPCQGRINRINARMQPKRIAQDREETDACQRNTPGCCIDHVNDDECHPW
jgi:hypothetical protein